MARLLSYQIDSGPGEDRVHVTQKLYRAKIVPAGTIFATKIVPPGTILVAESVPALPKVYWVVRKDRLLYIGCRITYSASLIRVVHSSLK